MEYREQGKLPPAAAMMCPGVQGNQLLNRMLRVSLEPAKLLRKLMLMEYREPNDPERISAMHQPRPPHQAETDQMNHLADHPEAETIYRANHPADHMEVEMDQANHPEDHLEAETICRANRIICP